MRSDSLEVPVPKLVRVGTVAISLAVAAVVGVDAARERTSAEEHAAARLSELNFVHAENVRRTFEIVDVVAQAAAEGYADYLGAQRTVRDPNTYLAALQHVSPILAGISWVDSEGNRVHASTTRALLGSPVAGLPQFTMHVARTDAGLFVGKPFRAVLDDRWLMPASRRVDGPDGSFGGIVLVGIDLALLDALYRGTASVDGRTYGLYLRSGTCLIRTAGGPPCTGRRPANGAVLDAITGNAEKGRFRAANPLGMPEDERLAVFTMIAPYPLVATNSVSYASIRSEWYDYLLRTFVLGGVAIGAVLFAGWQLARRIERDGEVRRELALSAASAHAAEERAESASRAKSVFLSNMSHELRTPLNAVDGFAQMLQLDRDATLTARQKSYVGYILEGSRRLLTLVNEVLDLAAVESGRIQLETAEFGARELVAETVHLMEPQATRRAIRIETDIPDVPLVARTDRQRLGQILLNLVSNAVKYNVDGGRVRVRVRRIEGRIRFEIEDTGRGIPAEHQARLYEPFNRFGAEFTATEGTGLGLSIVRRLVDEMGGTISFVSEPGRGTRFTVDMPAAAGAG